MFKVAIKLKIILSFLFIFSVMGCAEATLAPPLGNGDSEEDSEVADSDSTVDDDSESDTTGDVDSASDSDGALLCCIS